MRKNNNIENCNWDLLAKYLANEASEDEKSILESWIGESDRNLKIFTESKRLLEKTDLFFQSNRFNEEMALQSVWSKIRHSDSLQNNLPWINRKRLYLPFLRYAAIVVFAIMLGVAGYYLGFHPQPAPGVNQIVSAKKQVLQEVVLPDGTLVTLNMNTKLSYPNQFSGKTREVSIQGEAFFEVKPNPEKPFVITAGNTKIRVVGTSFNVCAYPESETVEVVVATGKVEVASLSILQNIENEVLLDPGDKATLFKKEKVLQKKVNDDPNFIAWKTHDFIFTKSTLAYVIQNLEKAYQVEIRLSDPEIEKLVLTAQFNNKPVDFILEVIRLTFNLKLSVENKCYVLSHNL